MKYVYSFVFILLLYKPIFSQTDLTLNYVGLLFNQFSIQLERPLLEEFGIEYRMHIHSTKTYSDLGDYNRRSTLGFQAAGKLYFNPKRGYDRFYVGPLARIDWIRFSSGRSGKTKETLSAPSLGIYTGLKGVLKSNLIFEFGLGIARRFFISGLKHRTHLDHSPNLSEVLFVYNIGFGYRFGVVNE